MNYAIITEKLWLETVCIPLGCRYSDQQKNYNIDYDFYHNYSVDHLSNHCLYGRNNTA